jgi:hypothetical protein
LEELGAGSRPNTEFFWPLHRNWRIEFDLVFIADESKDTAVLAFDDDCRFTDQLVYELTAWLRKLSFWKISEFLGNKKPQAMPLIKIGTYQVAAYAFEFARHRSAPRR